MIRFILAVTFLVLFLIVTLPVVGVEWLIHKKFPYQADISQLRMAQWVMRVVIRMCGIQLTVTGEENIPTDRAVVYVGNHRSIFDIVITYARCPRLTGYISKDSMANYPILSLWMKRLHCLFLDRKDIKAGLKTILTGIDKLKNGISICIFPEGTRSRGDSELDMLPFKEGSMKLAEKSGCPIIPMAITGSADIFENQFPRVKPVPVKLSYGKPIYVQDLSKEDQKHLAAYTQNIILEMLKEHI